jgi:hypothetical protein
MSESPSGLRRALVRFAWLLGIAAAAGLLTVSLQGPRALSTTGFSMIFAALSVDILAYATSTLVVAALFQPLRRRAQAVADRRFGRSRYDSEPLIATFGERLRDEVGLATIRRDMRATVDAAARPSGVGPWLRGRSEGAE